MITAQLLTSAQAQVQHPVASAEVKQMRQALSAAEQGDAQRALLIANSIIAEHPDFEPALKLQGSLLEDIGNGQAAAVSYQKALALAPNDPELLMKVGAYKLLTGDRVEAIRLLTHCLRIAPRDGDTLYYLAQAYHLQGDDALALKTIKECLRLQPSNVAVWQKYGELLCSSGSYEEGLHWLQKAQQSDATLPRIDFDIGAANFNNMDFSAAAKYSSRAVELQPNDAMALALLAAAEEKQGQWQESKSVYERILASHPDDVASLLGLGHCEVELKDFQSAVDVLHKTLDLDPTRILAHFFLSRAYAGLGNSAGAQHEAELHNRMMDQVSFAPRIGDADKQKILWDKARQLLIDSKEDDAIRLLEGSSNGPASTPANAYVMVASIYLSLGRADDTQRALNHALELNPKVPGAHTYGGILALRQGDLGRAENAFDAELARDPNYEPAIAELGELRYRQGRWHDAAEQLAKSKTTVPSLLYLLCDSYFREGNISDADLTAETIAAYGRSDTGIMRGLVDLLNRNGQSELSARLSKQMH